MVVVLQFTSFDVEFNSVCKYDHLTITEGDGTTLMEKSCGTTLPTNMTSNSNMVSLFFKTDDRDAKKGWSVGWSALKAGVSFLKRLNVFHKTRCWGLCQKERLFCFFVFQISSKAPYFLTIRIRSTFVSDHPLF